MEKLQQRRTVASQVFPFPTAGEQVWETPPCFVWLPEGEEPYRICVKGAGGFCWEGTTPLNFLVPDVILPPGTYTWNLYAGQRERGWVEFAIVPEAVEFLRPTGKQIYDAIPGAQRPRHLFCKSDIGQILKNHAADVQTLRRNIALAITQGIPEPPRFCTNPKAMQSREYSNLHREMVDRNLVACALGWQLLEDAAAAAHGKALLLEICSWDPEAECTLLPGKPDGLGLSNARCLPAVYDLLYDLLTPAEHALVRKALSAYAQQCEDRLIQSDFLSNPGNSHVGRVPAFLADAAMVLKGTDVPEQTLIRWLDRVTEIFGGIFPFYGCPDGSWAEGPFYASSYAKWFLPFFNAVERFMHVSYLDRPFYQRFSQFMLHFADPAAENHPFGDGYWCKTEDPEWPGFMAQDPVRVYAQRFGPPEARQMESRIPQPEYFLLHLLDVFLPVGNKVRQHITGAASCAQAFPYGGFVSLRSNLTEKSMALLARASRYGTASHAHADQGSFALQFAGTTLITPTGYYGRGYHTEHHWGWTKTTQAHNCILVDGQGQLVNSAEPVGRILECTCEENTRTALLDLSEAYPMLTKWQRRLTMDVSAQTILVEDTVEAPEPVTLDWLLHSLSAPEGRPDGSAWLVRNGIRLDILPQAGLSGQMAVTDRFDVDVNAGQEPQYHVSPPKQYHMRWHTQRKKEHHIRVLLRITNPAEERKADK